VKFLALVAFLGKSLLLFFFIVLVIPIRFLVRNMLLPLSVRIYQWYLPIKQTTKKFLAPAKNSWLYVFTTRYVLHIMIALVTLGVTASNITAQEVQTEDFGRGTAIAAVVGTDFPTEIIETAQNFYVPKNYRNEEAVLAAHISPSNAVFVNTITSGAGMVTGSGDALVKANLIDTSTTGRPREAVEEYTVQGGDTISSIASNFGISTNTILWANDLTATNYIKPGQKLRIPPVSGVLVEVKSGDSVASLAKKYKADEAEILAFNLLPAAEAIEAGQHMMIPGGEIEPPPPPKPTAIAYNASPSNINLPSAPISGAKLQWPTPSHRINQYFRYGHTGVDIDSNRSPIYAAESGTVTSAGWSGGYGLNIVINHGGGMQTLYGHFSSLGVSAGQQVSRGQVIGISGCTGWCTGDHLHFEVIIGGRKLNPLSYI
jgi:murein DD-endopeptidase MepM/ murein hydrolase activator NlpD